MNELIMAALENAKIQFSSLTIGDKEMILDVVKFVCKAQRNACLRIYESNWERQYMTELIKNAEITKEDYE